MLLAMSSTPDAPVADESPAPLAEVGAELGANIAAPSPTMAAPVTPAAHAAPGGDTAVHGTFSNVAWFLCLLAAASTALSALPFDAYILWIGATTRHLGGWDDFMFAVGYAAATSSQYLSVLVLVLVYFVRLDRGRTPGDGRKVLLALAFSALTMGCHYLGSTFARSGGGC